MKKVIWLINFILIISLICLNLTCTFQGYDNAYEILNIKNITIVSSIFTLIIGIIIFYYYKILDKIINKEYCFGKIIDIIIALILSLRSSIIFLKYFILKNSYLKVVIFEIIEKFDLYEGTYWPFAQVILNLAIIPILFIIWLGLIKYLIPYIIKFLRSLTTIEKRYLIVINIILFLLVLVVITNTNVFNLSFSKKNQHYQYYDVLYTSDASWQIVFDSYQNFGNEENDIRQPLFALFAFPFGIVASTLSEIFNYLPYNFMYSFFISILQCFCLSICTIFISRMINKKSNYFSLIMYSCLFTTIFFALNIEQYVFGIFWLLLLIYIWVKYDKSYKLLFCASSGTLLTNAILLPFVVKKDTFKDFIKECFKYCFMFGSLIIVFGQLHTFLNTLLDFGIPVGIDNNVLMYNRLLQYISFISDCFIAPSGMINYTKYEHVSYQLQEVTTIDIFGLILIILMILSFILNRKEKIVKISFGWFLFSFFILCIMGWGACENGLIIYGVYFSWAYFILIYKLLDNLLIDHIKIRNIMFYIIIISLLGINLFGNGGIIDLIKFGIEHYPFTLNLY